MIRPSDKFRTFSRIAFLCTLGLLPLCGCQHAQVSTCPIQAQDVLRDLNVTDVNQAEVVAWTSNLKEVVVTGRRGTKYPLIVAYRNKLTAGRWELAEIQLMLSDGTDSWCEWKVGDMDYEHPPTRDDINKFLDELHPVKVVDAVLVFREDVK